MTYKLIDSKFIKGSTTFKLEMWSNVEEFTGKVPTEVISIALLEKTDEYDKEGPSEGVDSNWNVCGVEYYPMIMLGTAHMAFACRLRSSSPAKSSSWAVPGFLDSIPNKDGSPVTVKSVVVALRSSPGSVNSHLLNVIALDQKLRQGGNWLGAARGWIKSKIPRGDTLCWSDNTPVSIPFSRLEELALTVAKAAVLEDREQRAGNSRKLRADILVKVQQYGRECRDEKFATVELATISTIVDMLHTLGDGVEH